MVMNDSVLRVIRVVDFSLLHLVRVAQENGSLGLFPRSLDHDENGDSEEDNDDDSDGGTHS
jgi:hypothetical protein